MTAQQKIANKIIVWKDTEDNKLTDEEAKEYAKELSLEIHNVTQLSTAELLIFNNLNNDWKKWSWTQWA